MLTERDIRGAELYGEIQRYFGSINAPGHDKIVDAADITATCVLNR